MWRFVPFFICWLVVACNSLAPEVKVTDGVVHGTEQKTIWGRKFHAFLGIPFAKPPIGDLRFKAPVPAEPWIGVWNATEPPSMCLQTAGIAASDSSSTYFGSEDCLYVNVYTPQLPDGNSKPLDVLVFIHGGGFQVFSGDTYGPEFILERDIVYVTFNYRLGPLGFLSLYDDVLPGNNGLWDQNLALKWIKKNIAAFGGDPNKITISGMSAGGASVHYHLLSKHSRGLFHKAILTSGCTFNPWAVGHSPLADALKVITELGCPTGDSVEIVECLKQRPAQSIVAVTSKLRVLGVLPVTKVGPIIEKPSPHAFIDKQPYDIIRDGELNDVPTLWAYNSEEGLFPGGEIVTDEEELFEKNWDTVAPLVLEFHNTAGPKKRIQVAHQIREHYLGGKSVRDNPEGVMRMCSERYFFNGIHEAIKAHVEYSSAPVHLYKFSYVGEKKLSDSSGIQDIYKGGACHGDDLHYVLRATYLPVEGNPSSEKMIKTLTDIWMEFIQGSPSWDPVTADGNKLTYLNVACTDPKNNKVETTTPSSGELLWKSFALAENKGDLINLDHRHSEL